MSPDVKEMWRNNRFVTDLSEPWCEVILAETSEDIHLLFLDTKALVFYASLTFNDWLRPLNSFIFTHCSHLSSARIAHMMRCSHYDSVWELIHLSEQQIHNFHHWLLCPPPHLCIDEFAKGYIHINCDCDITLLRTA